jgi:hypothetical protein
MKFVTKRNGAKIKPGISTAAWLGSLAFFIIPTYIGLDKRGAEQ